ncbi:conserved hypothetical protein [Tenacibaculum sediminilitoris]|uniref:contractile injection system tape measure protein n=1 Tax=Tenacibaculum sediminilitoris TaxID=1820334 RepID=UPI00389448C1
MIKNNNHIVARCYWNTFFDNKKKGKELQDTISHWSEYCMPREINSVFDAVCSEEQTLKIKNLELDLGVIHFENLEEDLYLKLKTQLLLKLSDILMYPNKYSQSIEVVTKENTRLATLKYFLLKGVMPWNYQKIKGSVNEIFKHQLQHNKQEMMHMLELVGGKEYVRKRMAWQLKEESIKEIIKNLERSNDNYIIEFSEEFVKIQEQEAIVKASLHDFKKNLLFWILNYLFTERGTMFNKVDFVQSNIQQMAKHFNIEYYELFALIEEAVDKVHEHSYVKNNFILILSILSQKQQNTFYKNPSTERQVEKQWKLLEHLLESANNRSTTYQKKRLEELIRFLSIKNPLRFKETMSLLEKNSFKAVSLSKDISEDSLKILFKVLSPTYAEKLISQIKIFEKFALEKYFKFDKKWLLGKAIQYLIEKKEAFASEEFSYYIIVEVSKSQKVSKAKVFENILNAKILTTYKNTETLAVFKELKQLYTLELTKEIPVFSKEKLIKVLKELQLGSLKGSGLQVTEKYYAILRVWLKENPKEVWTVLKTYKKQEYVQELLLVLLDNTAIITPLLKKIYSKQYEVLKKIEYNIDQIVKRKPTLSQSLQYIKSRLFIEGVKVLISSQKLDTVSFIKLVFEQLSFQKQQPNNKLHKESIISVVESLLKDNQEFSEAQKSDLKSFVRSVNTSSKLDVLKKYIKEYNDKQKEVAKILTLLVREKKINTKDFKQFEKSVSQYLLKEGYALQENCIREYQKQRNQLNKNYTAVEIKKVISEIYWQSIADYQCYKGDKKKFKIFFNTAVLQFLGALKNKKEQEVEGKIFREEKTTIKNIKLRGEAFSVKELLLYVKKAIKKETLKIETNKKSLDFKEVLLFLLEQYPVQIHELFRDESITTKQLINLQSILPFQQFVVFIEKDELRDLYKDILTLFLLVQEFVNNSNKIENEFWKEIVQQIKDRDGNRELNTLVDIVLEDFSIKKITALEIVRVIKDENIQISRTLRELLVKRNPTFELLEKSIQKSYNSKIITSKYKTVSIVKLVKVLCIENKIPSWFLHSTPATVRGLVNEVLRDYPLIMVSVLNKNTVSDSQFSKLTDKIEITTLLKVLKELYPYQQTQLNTIEKLYKAITYVPIENIAAKEIQHILLKKVLKSWVTSNWKLIGVTSVWKELLWEVCTKKNIEERQFIKAFDDIKSQLPVQLQLSYNELKETKRRKKTTSNKIKKQENMNTQRNDKLTTGVTVPNAGIVLLNSYFLMLFERLSLVKINQFISENTRLDAIHYLQYLATGMTKTEESLLALNKIICGVSLSEPISEGIEISNKDKNLIDGLLTSAIGYWGAIGDTSIEGFRGNWLVREGILREEEDRWSLIVEKRPYDVLMLKSPFSFSIIKLPWMVKPLHVTWPF